jgi:hypothetical protein
MTSFIPCQWLWGFRSGWDTYTYRETSIARNLLSVMTLYGSNTWTTTIPQGYRVNSLSRVLQSAKTCSTKKTKTVLNTGIIKTPNTTIFQDLWCFRTAPSEHTWERLIPDQIQQYQAGISKIINRSISPILIKILKNVIFPDTTYAILWCLYPQKYNTFQSIYKDCTHWPAALNCHW